MNKKILILFSHPALQKSKVNKKIIEKIKNLEGITFHDLYEAYPDFLINVSAEQNLLLDHDVIVFHHPFYWYSCPSILKEWIDLVLQYGFAYGPGGDKLNGKKILSVITTGASKEAYTLEGHNKYSIREFLLPFEQTANLCMMQFLPPLVIHDAIKMNLNMELHHYIKLYENILKLLRDDKINFESISEFEYINDYYKSL